MELPVLEQLAAAVDSFWSEVVYLYSESIDGRHEWLEKQQALERKKRAGRGCPWDPPLEGTTVTR